MEVWVILVKTKRAHNWYPYEAFKNATEARRNLRRLAEKWPEIELRATKFVETEYSLVWNK